MTAREEILVLDFGGQYNQLIARRIRELNVFSEMIPFHTPLAEILAKNPRGIIFSGGPNSVYDQNAPTIDPALYQAGIPILGICYGMQLMAHQLGGEVRPSEHREYGKTELELGDASDRLLAKLESPLTCWMSHGDKVIAPPPGFTVTAGTASAPVAAMADPIRKLYGVQFHPEVRHTPRGQELLRNFAFEVCGCRGDWSIESFVSGMIEEIRQQVGDEQVLCALSGGVDSSVAAVLVHRAIGDQLTCVFVNHGLLRKGEAEQVQRTFAEQFNMRLVYADEVRRFLQKLEGVTDPEQKRKIIGNEFIRVFEAEARQLGDIKHLVQGTLYPDIIESGTSTAATIKTHHNVGGLPEDMQFTLLEPLKWLFKDEVRQVGEELGLPEEIVWRQPFPGPGLAIRIIGDVTEEKLDILREADAILIEEIKQAGLYREIWQSFAVLPSVRSVGVMGDGRTYAYPIVIRAVTSDDAMTADWARLPYDLLERISNRIVNEVQGVNRVVYDVTSKPPGTIEWE
ncbi:MAG: glutamine-hydrolyzing GMP synthase [Firmicutes bacterium]|nr:glutamine-hydrolyzing GMP synthase [Bacillota bacterium]